MTTVKNRASVEKHDAFTTDVITWQPAQTKKKKYNSRDEENDAVIDAYLAGRKEGYDSGLNEMQRGITKLLKQNASTAAIHTNVVLDFLNENKFSSVGAYLKVCSWDDLKVIVLVNEDSFVKSNFKEVYNLVYDLEEASEADNLMLNFSFAPYNGEFNLTCLNADGYSLKYKEASEKAPTKVASK